MQPFFSTNTNAANLYIWNIIMESNEKHKARLVKSENTVAGASYECLIGLIRGMNLQVEKKRKAFFSEERLQVSKYNFTD